MKKEERIDLRSRCSSGRWKTMKMRKSRRRRFSKGGGQSRWIYGCDM